MKIEITEKKVIEVTPEFLALIFWNMDNDQQAEFFDKLSRIAGNSLAEQMKCVALFTDSLSSKALDAMAVIGEDARERIKETL